MRRLTVYDRIYDRKQSGRNALISLELRELKAISPPTIMPLRVSPIDNPIGMLVRWTERMDVLIDIGYCLLAMIACYLFAAFIIRFKEPDIIKNKKSGRFGAIDGLRGYLALGVFIHHYVITYHWKLTGVWDRPPTVYFENVGKVGVGIFFIITGFLFTTKLLASTKPTNWPILFKSRLFRIYPLYIFALTIILYVVAVDSDFQLHTSPVQIAKQIIIWIGFSGFDINEFRNTKLIIAGVEWTLKYEWLFYMSLPLISFAISKGRVATALLTAIIVYFYLFPVQNEVIDTRFLILFVVGGYIAWFRLRLGDKWEFMKSHIYALLSLTAFIGAHAVDDMFGPLNIFLMTLAFSPIAFGNTIFGLMYKKPSIFLGEISYSIYLLHGISLYFAFTLVFPDFAAGASYTHYMLLMPVLAIIVTFMAWITYSGIEAPMMALGKMKLSDFSALRSFAKKEKKAHD